MERLKEKRKELGLTQAQLAARVGCTQKDVARWETDEREPRLSALKKLAEALECKVDDII